MTASMGSRAGTVAALAFAAVVSLVAVRTFRELGLLGVPRDARHGMQDFRDAVYYPVVSLLEGRNPYDAADHLARYPVGSKFSLYAPLTLLLHLPLGLLAPLAGGNNVTPAMRAILPITDSLRTELPRMLEEHKAIHAATVKLGEAGKAANNAAAIQFAETLALHAQNEEEILYPAALLVGDIVRARLRQD